MNNTRVRVALRGVAISTFVAVVGLGGLPANAAPPAPPGSGGSNGSASNGVDTLTGVVQDIVVDNPRRDHGAEEEVRRVLRARDKIVPLTDGALPGVDSGATVRATLARASGGGNAGDARRALSGSTLAEATAPATVAGTHYVYPVIVTPRGSTPQSGLTASAVKTAVGQAASYWSGQTGGKVRFALASAAVPAYVSGYTCGPGAEMSMWNEALRSVSIPATGYRHLMIFAPAAVTDLGCAYGLGSLGATPGTTGLTFVADTNQSLVAHELGHNLGLDHSGALRCANAQDGVYSSGWPAGCQEEEYGDLFDVMGYSGTGAGEGSLNAVHLTRMGLLPTAVQTIATAGLHTATIAPLSAAATARRAVRIVGPTGQTYYVEYRTNSGRDTAGTGNGSSFGVRVLRQDPATEWSGSVVLDPTPTAAFDYTNNLANGTTFVTADRKITITVTSATAARATISVGYSTSAPARAVLSGPPASALAGQAITARVAVVNHLNRPAAGWTVYLQRYQRGGRGYVTIATRRTDAKGVASLRFSTGGVSALYRYVTAATAGAPVRVSNSRFVTVRTAVAARPRVSVARAGTRLIVSGAISPVPVPVVYLHVLAPGGKWTAVGRATVRGTAVVSSVQLKRRGVYHVRLCLTNGAGGRYLGNYSRAYPVRVY